jgi:hypothetical protein
MFPVSDLNAGKLLTHTEEYDENAKTAPSRLPCSADSIGGVSAPTDSPTGFHTLLRTRKSCPLGKSLKSTIITGRPRNSPVCRSPD